MTEISLYNLAETSNPDIFRYVNHEGDWKYYYIKSEDEYIPAVNKILNEGLVKGYGFQTYLLSVTKEEAEKILSETGERGSRLHIAYRMLIEGQALTMDTLLPNDLTGKPEKITFDEWQAIMAFQSFCQKYTPQNITTEETLASSKLGIAGTTDWVAVINDPKLGQIKVLLDFKTGSGIHLHHKAQVAAYYALKNDKSIEYTGILRLGTAHKNGQMSGAGYELKLFDKIETKKHWEIFLHAKGIHDGRSEPFEVIQVKIPFEIKINIPKFKQPETPKAKSPAIGKKVKKVKKQDVTDIV